MKASWLLGPIALGLLLSHAAAFAVHQGCYVSSADGVRALPFKAAEGASMTVEACRKLALARFVNTFSLEAGNSCWLDPANGNLTYLTRFGSSDACDVPCTGDAGIVCGGQQQANIYLENQPEPGVVPPNDYSRVGCYRDDASARRMTLLWSASNSMTLDLCANIAFSEQRLVFGVEGGSECWAGQAVDSAKALGTSNDCTIACPGNSSQICGGPLALNIYALRTAPWLEADSSADPKALVAASCVGAAASSEACKGVVSAAAGVAPNLLAALTVVLGAALAF